MIREIIEEYGVDVECIRLSVLQDDEDGMYTGLVFIVSEDDENHQEIEIEDKFDIPEDAIQCIYDCLSNDNLIHLVEGHLISVFHNSGVVEIVCLSSLQIKHPDDFVFWRKPDLGDEEEFPIEYLLELYEASLKKDNQNVT